MKQISINFLKVTIFKIYEVVYRFLSYLKIELYIFTDKDRSRIKALKNYILYKNSDRIYPRILFFGHNSVEYQLQESAVLLPLSLKFNLVCVAPLSLKSFVFYKLVYGCELVNLASLIPEHSEFGYGDSDMHQQFAEQIVDSTLTRIHKIPNTKSYSKKLRDRRIATSKSLQLKVVPFLKKESIDVILLTDRGYSPEGEFFFVGTEFGVGVITWNTNHDGKGFILKKYDTGNRSSHPVSVSRAYVDQIVAEKHKRELANRVFSELERSYQDGEWYCEVGTQVGARYQDRGSIARIINLSGRPVVTIFSHILYDATKFFGCDLFEDYADWLEKTLDFAVNDNTKDWILKIHPANRVKRLRDGVSEYVSELDILELVRKRNGLTVDTVNCVEESTDISALSLLKVSNLVVTVRGTVGLEAGALGKPVLVAGSGRYDFLEFAIAPNSVDEYFKVLEAQRWHVPAIGSLQAQAYLHGILLERPYYSPVVSPKFMFNSVSSLEVNISHEDHSVVLSNDADRLRDWITESNDMEFYGSPATQV